MNVWFRRDTFYKMITGLLLLCTALLAVFQILPALHTHQQLRLLQREFNGENTNWYEIYLHWKEEKERKANYLRSLEVKIAHEENLPQLIEAWQWDARSLQVEWTRYTPGTRRQDSEYVCQKVQMVLRGEYLSLLRFLQRMMRTTSCRNMRLILGTTTSGLQCTMDFELFLKAGKRNGDRMETTQTE